MPTHVEIVQCPKCNRSWSGHFEDGKEIKDADKVCKDCKDKK